MSTVLVVDDDQAVARLIDRALGAEHIGVVTAINGEDGLAVIQHADPTPDLILLDLAMPGMDGREFFRRARSDGYDGPILFCSAHGAAAANRELGGQGAIDKPFDPDVLVASVRRQLAET